MTVTVPIISPTLPSLGSAAETEIAQNPATQDKEQASTTFSASNEEKNRRA
jgi:hypothetical protein